MEALPRYVSIDRVLAQRVGPDHGATHVRRAYISNMPEAVYQFAEALRILLDSGSPSRLESCWDALSVEEMGWDVVSKARKQDLPRWDRILGEVDGLLLRLLDRMPDLASGSRPAEVHVRTFRLPMLERLQHATAAALVAQRFGPAGLHTVVADSGAPLARRYFAFLTLAERHPENSWPLFSRYLRLGAHHAFVGTAAEAARFYPGSGTEARLVDLFQKVRNDPHLRPFLSPRILGSLHFLASESVLPFLRDLLVAGHTFADPEQCEVTRSLVLVRRLTGRIEPNIKFADSRDPQVGTVLDHAESLFDSRRDVLVPVVVI